MLAAAAAARAGLWPLPSMALADAAPDVLPFLRAGGAVLARTAVLLGAKTLATATATRCAFRERMREWMDGCIDPGRRSSRWGPFS